MRILVIEDETKIASFIERGLTEHKFAVDIARDGEEGLYMADINCYDAILLDIMLPKVSGIDVCNQLRKKKNNTPIIMLTARDDVKDKVNGLNAGADDYLSKPFAFDELIARIRALLRRERKDKIDKLKVADLELDIQRQEVKRADKKIKLTNKEYSLLEYLMFNSNQVVTRTMISEHVWKESFDSFTNVIDVHIRYLRSKVDKDFESKLIHTVRGAGYILTDSNESIL